MISTHPKISAFLTFLALALIPGCVGLTRGCSSGMATSFGADWVIVQMSDDGIPYRCWVLEETSVTNEENSDGVYWLSRDGHLVHISGHYNRVQVEGGRWNEAYAELGLTEELCEAVQRRTLEFAEIDPE